MQLVKSLLKREKKMYSRPKREREKKVIICPGEYHPCYKVRDTLLTRVVKRIFFLDDVSNTFLKFHTLSCLLLGLAWVDINSPICGFITKRTAAISFICSVCKERAICRCCNLLQLWNLIMFMENDFQEYSVVFVVVLFFKTKVLRIEAERDSYFRQQESPLISFFKSFLSPQKN